MSLNPGDLLRNRYRISGIIGKGGMGAVYRGEDTALQTTVAIKENLNPLPQAVKQFKREAVLLASLRHPNLPRVTDHFIEGDSLQYLIMDYVPGDDLKTILERQGALPESQVLGWCREISDALTYLHKQDPPVTHRDIKPANIKITPDGKPVLVDFGIAKASEAGGVTTTGARSLTPGFAPPEQYGSSPTDSRSDQYSLAATIYNLLTGQIPPDSLERALEQTALKPPRELNPKISPAVDASIWKAMSLSPTERFPSVKDFYEGLIGDTELSVVPSAPTIPAGREPLTVIRHTPEKTTKEKNPPPTVPIGGRRIPVAYMALGGALLCLALTGLGVGAYALSGAPASLAAARTPTAKLNVASPDTPGAGGTIAVAAEPTFTPTMRPSPTATRTETTVPTSTGGSRLLAFVSNRGGSKYQIFTHNLETKEIRQLTNDSADKGRLAWSPDGRKIYYEAKTSDGTKDIFVMDADGSNPVNLTKLPGSDETYPAPSPVGNLIAFVSNLSGSWKMVYWMNLDGGGLTNVSAMHNGEHFKRPQEWDPAWSPDGITLYIVLNPTGKTRIYRWDTRFPINDPVVVNMVDGEYLEGEPAISPNGEYLAYTQFFEDGTSEICIANTDLAKRKECKSPLTNRAFNSDANWSPDGQWLAYTGRRTGNNEIHLVMISGAGDINLTDNPAADLYPAWQPAAPAD